jgi:hypothetical protein
VQRAASQHLAEDHDSEAPSLLARQLVQRRIGIQGELFRVLDRDAHPLGPEAELPQLWAQPLAGAEQKVMARVAARGCERQERKRVPVRRATAEEEAQAGRESQTRFLETGGG